MEMRRTQKDQAWSDLLCLLSSKFVTNQTKRNAVQRYNEKFVWTHIPLKPQPPIRVRPEDVDRIIQFFGDYELLEES